MDRPFPIVEYARKIGKNTAEFTAVDLSNFMKWWMKQPLRKDLVMKNTFKQQGVITGRKTFQTMEEAGIEEVEELTEEHEAEEAASNEVVVELGLTKKDIQALVWGLGELLNTYDFHEFSEVGESLTNLKTSLDKVI